MQELARLTGASCRPTHEPTLNRLDVIDLRGLYSRSSPSVNQDWSEGKFLATIAAELNADGLATGQGGRQWWAGMSVLSLLQRVDPAWSEAPAEVAAHERMFA